MSEKLEIRIVGLEKDLKRVTEQVDKLDNSVDDLGSSFGGLGSKAKVGLLAVGAGLTVALGKSLSLGLELEKTKTQIKTFFGGDEIKANRIVDEMNEFANATAFTNEEVIQSGKSLLAFGIKSDKLEGTLQALGDVAAGTGTNFNELATIYGKARVQGRLFAEDINQLTGRGINVIPELAKQLGVNETAVKKLVSEGKVGFDQLEIAFKSMGAEGGTFHNAMLDLSKTAGGKLSTALGKLGDTAARFGLAMLTALEPIWPIVFGAVAALESLSVWIQENTGLLKDLGVVVGLVAIAWGVYVVWQNAATIAVGLLAIATWDLNAALLANPIGFIVGGLALLAAGLVIAWHKSEMFRSTLFGLWAAAKTVFTNIGNFFGKIFDPIFKAIDAFKNGDFIEAGIQTAKGLFNLTPLGMAKTAVEFAADGGFTDGVADAFKGGLDEGAADFKADKLASKLKEKTLSTGNGTDLDGVGNPKVDPDATATGKNMSTASGNVKGTSMKNINITFENVVENFTVATNNISEGVDSVKDKVAEAILTVLNDANRA